MDILASPRSAKNNPYIDLLYEGVGAQGGEVRSMSLKNARSRCDICHVHWPDLALSSQSLVGSVSKVLRLFGLLTWFKLRWGAKVVWTVHNLEPHERTLPYWWRRLFYWIWLWFVDGCIFMSEASRQAFEEKYQREYPHTIIPHGHYCDMYDRVSPESGLRERLRIRTGDVVFGHYGQIREYKNVPYLMREFSKLEGAHLKLIVAGKVRQQDGSLLEEIKQLAESDRRIHFVPGFVSDEAMKGLYELTHWAVLPYRDILNSGSALLALSLGCPVLVPDLPTMVELQSKLSPRFVKLIPRSGLLSGLNLCFDEERVRCERSDLSELDWHVLSAKLVDFYELISTVK